MSKQDFDGCCGGYHELRRLLRTAEYLTQFTLLLVRIMARVLLFACVVSAVLVPSGLSAEEGTEQPGRKLFESQKVIQLHLTMAPEQFASLEPAAPPGFRPPGFGQPPFGPVGNGSDVKPGTQTHRNTFGVEFPWARGEVEFDGTRFAEVGVRYKGNYTFMATMGRLKRSLKLDFNRFRSDQRIDGQSMLNLHCGVSDPSLTREALSYRFFQEAGVPAPRTSFVELTLTVPGRYDREYVGLFTLVEQVNKPFLNRHFQSADGLLMKPEGLQGGPAYLGRDWKPYEDRCRPEKKAPARSRERVIEWTHLITHGTDADFVAKIGNYLDVDAFLRFVATNALLSNLDSFLGFGHNYYLYLDPRSQKFVFIPWDLDASLAAWPAVGTPEQLVELSLDHPHAGNNVLLDRILAVPEFKQRYKAVLTELASSSFSRAHLVSQLDRLEAIAKEPLAREAGTVKQRKERNLGGPGFGFGGGALGQSLPTREFIDKRTSSVSEQLAGKSQGYIPKPFGMEFGQPPAIPPRDAKNRGEQ